MPGIDTEATIYVPLGPQARFIFSQATRPEIRQLDDFGTFGDVDFPLLPLESASLFECTFLIRRISRLFSVAEAVSRETSGFDIADPETRYAEQFNQYALSDFRDQLGAIEDFRAPKSQVVLLHYGSPFLLHIGIAALSVPGLGALVFGAKRLFGLDLEFKAYREQRKVEYLKAKRIAEYLEAETPPKIAVHLGADFARDPWVLQSGEVFDGTETPEA